jgi:fructose/tagatose bisphosphate aldolase
MKVLILSTLVLAAALPAAAFTFAPSNQNASPFLVRAASTRLHSTPVADAATESMGAVSTEKLRNIAVIAHVDHGKTTLVRSLSYCTTRVCS